jgi:hypothetical protein
MGVANVEILKAFFKGELAEPPTGLRTDGNRLFSCGYLLAYKETAEATVCVVKRTALSNRPAALQHRRLVMQMAELAGLKVLEVEG